MPRRFIKIFFALLALLLIILFIFSDGNHKPDPGKVEFTALTSSQIRFQNLRSFFYEIKDFPNDLQTVFRFKNRVVKSDSLPFITFAIVLNKRHGEAYIMPELSAYFNNYDSLALRWEQGQTVFKRTDAEEAYRFAAQLYNTLLYDKKLEYYNLSEASWKPIMEDSNERKQLKMTLKDYFTLTSKY
jgi:hypothetical protein